MNAPFQSRTGEPAYVHDFAAEIDDEADKLAEELHCSRELAEKVLKWREASRCEEILERRTQLTLELRIVISELVAPGNVLVKVWALAYASGLAAFMPNGGRCPAEKAEHLGVTRADLSHFIRRWKLMLGLTNTIFSRTETAAQNSRNARLRVLGRNGNTNGNGVNHGPSRTGGNGEHGG